VLKSRVSAAYPDSGIRWSINFPVNPHPAAAIARTLEQVHLLHLMNVHSCDVPKGFDMALADVGGSLRGVFSLGTMYTHVCAPVIDSRDSQRLTESLRVCFS